MNPYNSFNVSVSIKDTDLFNEVLDITKYLLDNANEEIKKVATEKINKLLDKEVVK